MLWFSFVTHWTTGSTKRQQERWRASHYSSSFLLCDCIQYSIESSPFFFSGDQVRQHKKYWAIFPTIDWNKAGDIPQTHNNTHCEITFESTIHKHKKHEHHHTTIVSSFADIRSSQWQPGIYISPKCRIESHQKQNCRKVDHF